MAKTFVTVSGDTIQDILVTEQPIEVLIEDGTSTYEVSIAASSTESKVTSTVGILSTFMSTTNSKITSINERF